MERPAFYAMRWEFKKNTAGVFSETDSLSEA